jgi:hypothetical protein
MGWSYQCSYELTRAVPFRWFTLLLVIEFTIASVLFSLLSTVTSGYESVPVYSINPNVTETSQVISWLPMSLTRKLISSCQLVPIAVGDTFITNNSALTYTLANVIQNSTTQTSLVYHNNPLENCSVNNIMILVDAVNRNAAQMAKLVYGAEISASITCSLDIGGATSVNLTTAYDYVPSTVAIHDRFTTFAGSGSFGGASLFWGEQAIALYCIQFCMSYGFDYMDDHVEGNGTFNKAALYFTPNLAYMTDITSPEFFSGQERLIAILNNAAVLLQYSYDSNSASLWSRTYPQYYHAADLWAKAFQSTILTDPGQTQYQPNMLSNATLLQYFTSNFSDIVNDVIVFAKGYYDAASLMNQIQVTEDYDSLRDMTGKLEVRPSTIATRYLCQTSQRKPTGNLILSVLVADLVLLQALWKVTMLIST